MKPTLKPAIFFGSGPVATESLARLAAWHPISLVVTKRAPPHHKDPAPVETYAREHNIEVLFADTKQELDMIKLPITSYGIVIDYGVIISQKVIEHFPLGIINSHFSKLPEWRGADPISFAILSGQTTTGVSLMCIDQGMDTGPLLATENLDIQSDDSSISLTLKLVNLSDNMLQRALPAYANGTITPVPQPNNVATYSSKLVKQNGVLNTLRPATEIARQVRAFASWPNSRFLRHDTWLTITKAHASDYPLPKDELVHRDGVLYLGCKTGSLAITELQPAGKNKMSVAAFMNGYAQKLSIDTV